MLINEKEKHLYCYKCRDPHLADIAKLQAEIDALVEMLKYSYDLIEFEEDATPVRELLNKHKGE